MLNLISLGGYYYGYGPSWTEVYGMIVAILSVIFAVVVFCVTMKAPVRSKNMFVNLFNFNCSAMERIVKGYVIATVTYNVLIIPTLFSAGVLTGFQLLFTSTIVSGIAWPLVVYTVGMSIAKILSKNTLLNDHFDVKDPEPVVPVAPVYMQQPYGMPVNYGAPAPAPVPAPAPAPTYAAPAPAPVYTAPTPAAAPAPAADVKACVNCGKEIKGSAKFCPFCGGNQ